MLPPRHGRSSWPAEQALSPIVRPEPRSNPVRSPKASEIVTQSLRKMIVDGELKDGDFLPFETELMEHFGVSRPTLREAVRVLESERLVEIRRGSRTGARVRVPGPEIVARPAALLLELSGATLSDVMAARIGIEPLAARFLAESAPQKSRKEFRRLVTAIPEAWETGQLAAASVELHRRMVELSGNATLAVIAGMLARDIAASYHQSLQRGPQCRRKASIRQADAVLHQTRRPGRCPRRQRSRGALAPTHGERSTRFAARPGAHQSP